jgi:predicted dehydrogenase
MSTIGVGIVGTGYMGKAHAVAMSAVGAVFDTRLRPTLEMVCATSEAGAAEKARSFGFRRSTADWRTLVAAKEVEAVVIASPQSTHRNIALAAIALGKPVLCEKPLGLGLAQSRELTEAAERSRCVNMVGFNYIRSPATQFARTLVATGQLGRITSFRAEHTEDFLANPDEPGSWRTRGVANGAMGDLAPHIINAALTLMGPIETLCAEVENVYTTRPGLGGPEAVTNDDQAQIVCRFSGGVLGSLFISRVATGRKMGYCYEIVGTKGALRFDGEDQNALWLYKAEGDASQRGFTKILTGPAHPDFGAFCLGPGHGTGYQDQIIIEARDFLAAIAGEKPAWPSFRDGMLVNQVIEAARLSHAERRWVRVSDV